MLKRAIQSMDDAHHSGNALRLGGCFALFSFRFYFHIARPHSLKTNQRASSDTAVGLDCSVPCLPDWPEIGGRALDSSPPKTGSLLEHVRSRGFPSASTPGLHLVSALPLQSTLLFLTVEASARTMARPDFVQPYPLHHNIPRQCARPPFTHGYFIIPVSRAMNHHTQVSPALTIPPPCTRDALQPSLPAPVLDGSQHIMTPPSAVTGDLATMEFLPWRPICQDDQSMTTDSDQATWPMTAETSCLATVDNPQARTSTSGSVVTPEVQSYRGYGGGHRPSVTLSVDCVRRSSSLAGWSEAPKFENTDVGQSAMLATGFDNAPSPSTTDTYYNDPRTPGSSRHSDSGIHVQDDRAHEDIFFEQALAKVDNSFGIPSSDYSMSAAMPSHAPAFHSASFGDMTLSAALQTQPAHWPMITMPTYGTYHPHGHGMPSGIPDPTSTYIDFQSVQPATVPPLLRPEVAQGFGEAQWDDGSGSYSRGGSEVQGEDNFQEDLNDRALNDAHARRNRDKYLLKMRNEGFSYKEIKRMGNFREAESTLRGRVRVLTKDKNDRVRRPEWTVDDVRLLRRAVARFSGQHGRGRGRDSGRLPWKQVSDYLTQEGSSYHFAAATCARKWKDLGANNYKLHNVCKVRANKQTNLSPAVFISAEFGCTPHTPPSNCRCTPNGQANRHHVRTSILSAVVSRSVGSSYLQNGKAGAEDVVARLTDGMQRAVNRYPILAGSAAANIEVIDSLPPNHAQPLRRETVSVGARFGPLLQSRRESTGSNTFALLGLGEPGEQEDTDKGQSGHLEVLVKAEGLAVHPIVKHLSKAEFLGTYDDLAARGMPASALVGSRITSLPDSPDPTARESPIFAVQATFVDGGVFVTVFLHHAVADERGVADIVRLMSSDQAFASTDVSSDAVEQSRSRDRLSGSRGVKAKRSEETKYGRAQKPSSISRPCSCHILAFDLQKIRQTTDLINERAMMAPDEPCEPIEPLDCLVAILWKAMARGRNPRVKVEERQSSTCRVPVDMRMRLDPALGTGYLGNACLSAKATERFIRLSLPFDIGTLGHAAHLVHESMAETTETDLRGTIAAINTAPDVRGALDIGSRFGADVAIADWSVMPMGTAATLSLGLGAPQFVREAGKECVGSGCILLPPREEDEMWEVAVQADDESMSRVIEDEGLLPFVLHVA
ncbi:hypothetical protein BST61_g5100 [Cercospora zeina]